MCNVFGATMGTDSHDLQCGLRELINDVVSNAGMVWAKKKAGSTASSSSVIFHDKSTTHKNAYRCGNLEA